MPIARPASSGRAAQGIRDKQRGIVALCALWHNFGTKPGSSRQLQSLAFPTTGATYRPLHVKQQTPDENQDQAQQNLQPTDLQFSLSLSLSFSLCFIYFWKWDLLVPRIVSFTKFTDYGRTSGFENPSEPRRTA